jgi:hypothetical protein
MQRSTQRELDAAAAESWRLTDAASEAVSLARFARAEELTQRALALADASLRHDSLLTALLLLTSVHCCVQLQVKARVAASGAAPDVDDLTFHMDALWRDTDAVALMQRCLALLHGRWRNGSLYRAVVAGDAHVVKSAPSYFFQAAEAAVVRFPELLPDTAEEEARVRGVYGALRCALDVEARGALVCCCAQLRAPCATSTENQLLGVVLSLVTAALHPSGGMLHKLRAVCGLTPAEEAELARLQQRMCDALLNPASTREAVMQRHGGYRAPGTGGDANGASKYGKDGHLQALMLPLVLLLLILLLLQQFDVV